MTPASGRSILRQPRKPKMWLTVRQVQRASPQNVPPASDGGVTQSHGHAQVIQADAARAGDAVPASARYFRRKRAPLLTAWVEGCKALGQTLLLPLISMVPCNGVLVDAK